MCFYNIPHLISTKTELCIVLCCEFFSFFCCLFTLLFHDSTDDSYVCSYITFSLWTVKKIFSIYRACISHNSRICATFYLLSLFIFHEERATEKIERGRKRVSSVWESCDDFFFGHQLIADHMKIHTIFSSWCIAPIFTWLLFFYSNKNFRTWPYSWMNLLLDIFLNSIVILFLI